MKPENTFTKKDIVIVFFCLVFVLINLSAIGSAGRQKAMESVCLSNLNQWGNMFQMWLNDHDGTFMAGPNKWFYSLAPYYGAALRTDVVPREYKIRFCPTAMGFDSNPKKTISEAAQQPFAAWRNGAPAGDATSPTEPWSAYYFDGSYGSNSWMYSGTSFKDCWVNSNVKGTNEIPLLLDSKLFGGRPQPTDMPPGLSNLSPEVEGAGANGTFVRQFCIDRHNGGSNALFMDFSARSVGLKELWTLKWHRTYNQAGPYTLAGNNGYPSPGWPTWMRQYKDY